ncbi:MAG: hypothetical protein ACSLFQ_18065 [Thermoanaerobaculia bacterium]
MKLDDELGLALRRRPAPHGFSTRVLERIDGSPAARVSLWRRRAWRGAIAAGLTLVISSGLWLRHEREERFERAQGEAAKQLALVAIRIASEKANVARDRVRRTDSVTTSKENVHEERTIQN